MITGEVRNKLDRIWEGEPQPVASDPDPRRADASEA